MRIRAISARDVPPVKLFEVEELSDVVVLAGPNGVGKTRLLQSLIKAFQNPAGQKNIRLTIEATSQTELEKWKKSTLDTSVPGDAQLLTQTLRAKKQRSSWKSSVVQFESDRTIQKIQPFSFTWDLGDPWEEDYSWEGTFGHLSARFQDTVHSIFRKVQSRRDRIGRNVEEALRLGPITVAPGEYPDPLLPFKGAFAQLLSPKQLLDPDPKKQQLAYEINGQQYPLESLSSGEREVVNIVFDFLLRSPEDCIVFFDEPELHLHPELSYKLLQTLQTLGANNQFIFCTHSPDIITASLEQSVVFVASPADPPKNQAVAVREEDETNQALRLLGHSIGIISLGKRLVLIEGQSSSLDKQVYGAVLKNRFPGLVLVPSGGKGTIASFSALNQSVLSKSLWGVEFFMLCDRDAVPLTRNPPELEKESHGHFKVLPRYHIENYFLETRTICKVFEQMEPEGSWLRSPEQVEHKLRELARSSISYAVALAIAAEFRDRVGNLDAMPSGIDGKSIDELVPIILDRLGHEKERISSAIEFPAVETRIRALYQEYEAGLEPGSNLWRHVLPGKQILKRFAASTRLDISRLKTMYVKVAEDEALAQFQEIVHIFESFAAHG